VRGDVGGYTSITPGAGGPGVSGYYDGTDGDLKVFRCSNRTCTPYARVGHTGKRAMKRLIIFTPIVLGLLIGISTANASTHTCTCALPRERGASERSRYSAQRL
jgi:hypothetical protein